MSRLCLGFFLFFLAFNGFTAVLVLFFKQNSAGAWPATTAFLIVGVWPPWCRGLIGPLVKRFGEQRLTLAGLGLVLVGCLMIPLAPVERSQASCSQRWRCWPSALDWSHHHCAAWCHGGSVAARCRPGQPARLQSLGSFLGPPLMGFSYELLGHSSPFLLAAAFLIGVAALSATAALSRLANFRAPGLLRGP